MDPMKDPPMDLSMDGIATSYVQLVLALGEHDADYVDAYYGPAEWREAARARAADLGTIRSEGEHLLGALDTLTPDAREPIDAQRRQFLQAQIGALVARTRQLGGERLSFDDEARALYGVSPPAYEEADFEAALAALAERLPAGPGSVSERYDRYQQRYAIAPERVEAVMRAAIDAARTRTLAHIPLPATERFELALVRGQPWSAYNWYQGAYASRIEVNTDQPLSVQRAIELASHEGYPGHHVYNALLERELVRGRGWVEFTVYPLFSPQSLIAEGSADYGVELAFPDHERRALLRTLFAAAGLPVGDVDAYDAITRAARFTGPATLEAARRYRDGRLDAARTAAWLQTYALASPERAQQRLRFFDRYGAYIVNYSYGEAVVRAAIDAASRAGRPRWDAFARRLSTPRTPSTLDLD